MSDVTVTPVTTKGERDEFIDGERLAAAAGIDRNLAQQIPGGGTASMQVRAQSVGQSLPSLIECRAHDAAKRSSFIISYERRLMQLNLQDRRADARPREKGLWRN